MAHTDGDFEHAAALNRATTPVEHTDDLRTVAEASDAVTADRLHEAVSLARARGRFWNHITLALGVSRQAARQRFADRAA